MLHAANHYALFITLFAILLGCNGASSRPGEAQVLGSANACWRSAACGTCHGLPVEGHTADQPAQCAACHGANGACDPNGSLSTKTDHAREETCVTADCHASNHGFAPGVDCASCHFAAAGRQSCPRTGGYDLGVRDLPHPDAHAPDLPHPVDGAPPDAAD